MNVKKRSGTVVPFDAGFIQRAITLAAAAAGEHDEDAIEHVTEAVTAKLAARGEDTVYIECIQDTVEETLLEQQLYHTARAYIRYRIEKQKSAAVARRKRACSPANF